MKNLKIFEKVNLRMKGVQLKNLKIAFALFLIFAMAFPLTALPLTALPTALAWDNPTQTAVAAGMKWDFPGAENYNASATRLLWWNIYQDKIPTYVYGVLSPNPVGVGQEMAIVMFNPVVPPGSWITNDVRYQFSVAITDPNGQTTNLPASGTITSDSTGTAFTKFTPTKVGNYSLTINSHEVFYKWYETAPYYDLKNHYGITFLESNRTYSLVVQEQPVQASAITNYPLPTEYWARPIEGQNQAWGQISSNWLNNAKDRNYGYTNNLVQTEGVAPNSGHIMWTKPLEDGGVVGGDKYFSSPGDVFSSGCQPYNDRFTQQIIMHGRLYYQEPAGFNTDWGGAQGGQTVCVDLCTGEEIWRNNIGVTGSGMAALSFGYYYDFDTANQHGVMNPGWLFAVSGTTWYSVHPLTGAYGQFNVTNVPSGSYPSGIEIIGPKGEILRYVIQNAGTTANPNWRLLQWNSSKVFPLPSPGTGTRAFDIGYTFNANTPSAYDWNVSLPIANSLTGPLTMRAVIYNDVLLCSNGTLTGMGFQNLKPDVTLWAVSLKPESRGQTLFGPDTYKMSSADGTWKDFTTAGEGVFIMYDSPSVTFSGYSMYTGDKLWEGINEVELNSMGIFRSGDGNLIFGGSVCIAYGKLFTMGYSGHVLCYDLYNGALLWTYAAPTNAQIVEYYDLLLGAAAEGKLYVGTYEHTPDTPLFKGHHLRCLNATTGEEIWTMLGFAGTQATQMLVADGVLVYYNQYDNQIYTVGKGPSAMSVEAPMTAATLGQSVVIRGTVTDISAGTKQKEQAARFPNGVPAVSDVSQSQWMEYVYMQKPRPTNTTGVLVTLSVVDANGNYREIGTTTSNDGTFSLNWKPDITGQYTVYASFGGSESYWSSHAVTYFAVDPAAATPAPTATPQADIATTGNLMTAMAVGVVAIIIAIAIVGLLLLRKRP